MAERARCIKYLILRYDAQYIFRHDDYKLDLCNQLQNTVVSPNDDNFVP